MIKRVPLFRDVGCDEDRVAAQGVELGDDVTAFLLAASADDDLRPLCSKLNGGGTANPRIAAGDQDDFSCKLTHTMLPPRASQISVAERRLVIVAAARVV